ncbi:hypothetical protein AQUSIP_17950 [Aquicella siphonis]|uniref:Sulfotransferase domain-containing protein n=1 Tax=Aquicella siphonis TaxID=254247 RepID=A0A5E4PJC6_9COXI|nr:sulfotransferase family 2 domain-containing protein [Aquicella siphonis]VVC76482.1 hypothetical protein AQUSIP_17950 [Aquicella siphonis]
MMDHVKSLIARYTQKKRYFIIASHGQTATLWLASALNQHQKIFCTHGYSYPVESADGRDHTPEQEQRRIQATNDRFWDLSVHAYLKELEEAASKPVIGNVHAFTIGRLLDLLPACPKETRRHLTLMNMVRHPVSRTVSTYKCWTNEHDETVIAPFVEKDFNTRCNHIIDYLTSRHAIDFNNNRNKNFVACLLVMEDITRDARLAEKKKIHNIKYEDITSDMDYLGKITRQLLGWRHKLSASELEQMFSQNRINRHNKQQAATPDQYFENWNDWQRDGFKFIAQRNDMKNVYSRQGYDFSFLNSL